MILLIVMREQLRRQRHRTAAKLIDRGRCDQRPDARPALNRAAMPGITGFRPNDQPLASGAARASGNSVSFATARFWRDAAYSPYSASLAGTTMFQESLPPSRNTQTSAL